MRRRGLRHSVQRNKIRRFETNRSWRRVAKLRARVFGSAFRRAREKRHRGGSCKFRPRKPRWSNRFDSSPNCWNARPLVWPLCCSPLWIICCMPRVSEPDTKRSRSDCPLAIHTSELLPTSAPSSRSDLANGLGVGDQCHAVGCIQKTSQVEISAARKEAALAFEVHEPPAASLTDPKRRSSGVASLSRIGCSCSRNCNPRLNLARRQSKLTRARQSACANYPILVYS